MRINSSKIHFDNDKDFWKEFPEMKSLFQEFYNDDKSKNKEKSSNIMWALLTIYSTDSLWYHIPDKEELAKDKIIGDPEFKWKDYGKVVDRFKTTVMSTAERTLLEWEESIRKRQEFLRNAEYDFDTMNDLDKAYRATPAIFKEYKEIYNDFMDERASGSNKKESLSDSNEI